MAKKKVNRSYSKVLIISLLALILILGGFMLWQNGFRQTGMDTAIEITEDTEIIEVCGIEEPNTCIDLTPSNFRDNPTYYAWRCSNDETTIDQWCYMDKPINGVCDIIANNCIDGSFLDVEDTSFNYLWRCLGAYGGEDVLCSLPRPLQAINILSEGVITKTVTSSGNSLFPRVITNYLNMYSELPPLISGDKVYISTGWTYEVPYNPQNNFVNEPNKFALSLNNPILIIGGDAWVNSTNPYYPTKYNTVPSESSLANLPFWRKHYYGAWAVSNIGPDKVFITIGENKNTNINLGSGNQCRHSTIFPNNNACLAGDDLDYYSAFIGTARINKTTIKAYSTAFNRLNSWRWIPGEWWYGGYGTGWVWRSENKSWIWAEEFKTIFPEKKYYYVKGSYGYFSNNWGWMPFEKLIDEGPILWPTTGYKNSIGGVMSTALPVFGERGRGGGIRHISSINATIDGVEYIYIFYQDRSFSYFGSSDSYREGGIKVARAPMSDGGKPGTFKTWTGYNNWADALPENWTSNGVQVTETGRKIYSSEYARSFPIGSYVLNGEQWYSFGTNANGAGWMKKFSSENDLWWSLGNGYMIRTTAGFKGFNKLDDYSIWGGNAKLIFGINSNSFSVAKLAGTDYYIGLADDIIGDDWGIRLYLSRDLVNWGESHIIEGTRVEGYNWGNLKLTFPHFMSKDFSTNNLIYPSEFYIVGTSPNEEFATYYQKLSISIA